MPGPDPQRQQSARSYARIQRRLYFLGLAIEAAVLVALWPGGLSVRLADATLDLPLSYSIYAVVLMAGYRLLALPLGYYGGLVLPRRFGLSTQRLGGWLSDRAKAAGLGLALGVGAVGMLYDWLIVNLPSTWWLAAAGIAIFLALLESLLGPLLTVPLFFKMKPLDDAELSQRLSSLADRAQARVIGVYTIDMSRRGNTANAALMGLGKTRRIVLGDTLLQSYTPDEIEVVLAHELGHHAARHIIKLEAFQAARFLAGFYLAHLALDAASMTSGFYGPTDVAAFPVLAAALVAFMLITSPLGNAYSRRLETEADRQALALTAKPDAFVSLMTRLTDQNLSEAHPSRWVEIMFYSHPPYYKRVRQAGGAA